MKKPISGNDHNPTAPFPLVILNILCQFSCMKNFTATIHLTITLLLGSVASASEKTPPPKTVTSDSSYSTELSLRFKSDKVHLRAGPGVRYSVTKRLDGAFSQRATLIRQEENWIKVRFEGQDHWVHKTMVDRNLTPPALMVLFKSPTVTLRSGPSEKSPITRVLEDAQYRVVVPVKKSGDWVQLIFEKKPYWAHSSEILSNPNESWNSGVSHSVAEDQFTFIEERKLEAASGSPSAMELVGSFYENQTSLHLEMAYMWLSLARDMAPPEEKARIQKHLDEGVISKLRDSDVAFAEQRIERCQVNKDCGETRRRVFGGVSEEPQRNEKKVTNAPQLSDDLLKRGRTAGELYRLCKNASLRSQHACKEYLLGVGEAIYWSEWQHSGKKRTFCIRKTQKQAAIPNIKNAFLREIVDHPEMSTMPAAPAVLVAMRKEFPCPER